MRRGGTAVVHKTDADGVRGRDSEKGMRDNDILYNWGVTGVNIWR